MSKTLTGSLVVCAAGAVAFVGALIVDPAPDRPAPAAAPAAPAQAPVTSAPAGGYGGGDTGGGAAPAAPAAPAQVQIADFTIASVAVAPGAQIQVINSDVAPHTFTANGGTFDSGTLDPGASATLTAPAAPGTYNVFCTIHPSMTATLTVG
ncbi:MAG: cupredoxin domain-containing protein [Actinomycetota bacterium]|nr:cupredoxin domain-containing protein [Actinomycetota bacterium]